MKKKRITLSVRTRFEVFKRDSFTCQYCGRTPPSVTLEADHIIPVSAGGVNDESNLLTACADCNRGKSDRQLSQVPEALDNQLIERRDRALQLREYNKFLLEVREEETREIELLGIHWCNKTLPPADKDKFTFSQRRQDSVRRFLKHLASAGLYDSIDLAFSRVPPSKTWDGQTYDEDTWKYFCGICWRTIKAADESRAI